MAFMMKQGDTLPNLEFRLLQPDGVTPLDLTNANAVNIVVRTVEGLFAFKKECDLFLPLTSGEGQYDWDVADTATPGRYEYEFEITWANGDIQTIPADSYFELVIVDDIG